MKAVLKPQDFGKYNITFVRDAPDAFHVVNLQSSLWSSSTSLAVCVNLGVFYKAAEDSEGRNKRNVKEYLCHWRTRLWKGDPSPTGETIDMWWDIESDLAATLASREIVDLLRQQALPAFDAIGSLAGLRALAKEEKYSTVWPPGSVTVKGLRAAGRAGKWSLPGDAKEPLYPS